MSGVQPGSVLLLMPMVAAELSGCSMMRALSAVIASSRMESEVERSIRFWPLLLSLMMFKPPPVVR